MESPRNKTSQARHFHRSFQTRTVKLCIGMAMFLVGFCFLVDDMAMRYYWLRLLSGSIDTRNSVHMTVVHLQHQLTPVHHPNNKIIIDVGLPRCGTNSFITFMKALFPDEPNQKFIHQYDKFSAYNLAEYLALGNLTSPGNPIFRFLTDSAPSRPVSMADNRTTTEVKTNKTSLLRAMADYPAFLLTPKAMDFPNVYWVQVTRDIEDLVDSTFYMIQRWMKGRCSCPQAPSCYKADRWKIMDRLYYNRYQILEYFCNNNQNASAIPRDLIRKLITNSEEQIANYLKDHPHYLHFKLEEDTHVKLQKLASFLGLESVLNVTFADKEFQANKRIFQVPSH
jgi:hypothetical protein